jgi:hypothetical protein
MDFKRMIMASSSFLMQNAGLGQNWIALLKLKAKHSKVCSAMPALKLPRAIRALVTLYYREHKYLDPCSGLSRMWKAAMI